ncbi:MAG: SDR family oxidoreductase [Opitutaceae bacterium]|nr:SDR family oxidoreductase [Opitutaceae bacterium]
MSSTSTRQLFELGGKAFLVVGGARALGYDMALALAEFGARGVVTSRDAAAATAAAASIAATTGQPMLGLSLDATSESSTESAVAHAAQHLGRIDILINTVGGGGGGSGTTSPHLADRSLAQWETIQRTNVTALFLVCRQVIPVMIRQGAGSIINIASIAGLVGRDRRIYPQGMNPQTVDYAAAKAAVIGFTTDLAALLGPNGIRVNVISPGGFARGQPRKFVRAYSDRTMLGRMGRDGMDLKGAAVFLASDASAYVTGHNLVVDGGFARFK